jgi:hypothetical protein
MRVWSRLFAAPRRSPSVHGVEPQSNVRFVLVCEECGMAGVGVSRGWRAYRADDLEDENDEPEVLFLCPDCSEREFGRGS